MILEGIGVKVILDTFKTENQKEKYLESVRDNNPKVFDSYQEYINQLDYEILAYDVDYDNLTERLGELNQLNDYVPIMLRPFLNITYYNNLNDENRDLIVESYNILKVIPKRLQFQREELNYWLKNHQEWLSIFQVNG